MHLQYITLRSNMTRASSLSSLTASSFLLSSTLSELASLCVAQMGVQGNNGTQVSKYRSGY